MKKSELKQIISEIVRRKLSEEQNNKTLYGYVMNEDPIDPTYQLIGYGNAKKSQWEKKIEAYAAELLDNVRNKNWRNAAGLLEKNGVFSLSVNMMKELSNQNLNEIDVTVDPKAGETKLGDADKRELANLQAQSEKITSQIKKIEGEVAKMQQTIQPKLQRAERLKAKLQKQQADIIRKIQAIQDKA